MKTGDYYWVERTIADAKAKLTVAQEQATAKPATPPTAPPVAKLIYRLTREAATVNLIVLDRYDFPMFYRAKEN